MKPQYPFLLAHALLVLLASQTNCSEFANCSDTGTCPEAMAQGGAFQSTTEPLNPTSTVPGDGGASGDGGAAAIGGGGSASTSASTSSSLSTTTTAIVTATGCDPACDVQATCTANDGGLQCVCNQGYSGDGVTCADINECDASPCPSHAQCANAPGTYTCTCDPGYAGAECLDIDECILATAGCDLNAICTNTDGAFSCTCKPGFAGDGKTCTDIDECAAGTDDCDANANCSNTIGSFTCTCNAGFTGNGKTCTDIDECAAGTDDCDPNANCANIPGSFTCACKAGFTGNGKTCTDIDECAAGTDDCSSVAKCTNTPGSFSCDCDEPYDGNGKSCVLSNFAKISAGASTCGVRTDGSLWCWGANTWGQLGTGDKIAHAKPVRVGSASNWFSVDTGYYHTCASRLDASLWCWGRNTNGQLGLGTTTDSLVPAKPTTLALYNVSVGSFHTCAFTQKSGGKLYCWGLNSSGQLGGPTPSQSLNVMEASFAGNSGSWWSVVANASATCGWRQGDDRLLCAGGNTSGQLGITAGINPAVGYSELDVSTAANLVGGVDYFCLTRNGHLFCSGDNTDGTHGDGTTASTNLFTAAGGSKTWVSLSARSHHTCGIDNAQKAYCWGRNTDAQVDPSGIGKVISPKKVDDASWKGIAAGLYHTCGIHTDGTVACWGKPELTANPDFL